MCKKIEEVVESFERKLEKKLQTNEGQPPYPFALGSWSQKFVNIPDFTFL